MPTLQQQAGWHQHGCAAWQSLPYLPRVQAQVDTTTTLRCWSVGWFSPICAGQLCIVWECSWITIPGLGFDFDARVYLLYFPLLFYLQCWNFHDLFLMFLCKYFHMYLYLDFCFSGRHWGGFSWCDNLVYAFCVGKMECIHSLSHRKTKALIKR